MINLKRILVPTDFSSFCEPAFQYACEFARRFQAELCLLHVVEDPYLAAPESGMMFSLSEDYLHGLRAAAERQLAEISKAEICQGLTVQRHVVLGSPLVEIVRFVREQQVDLIVIGTHGRTGLVHVLMGSVAENVVRKAPCPVLTAKTLGHQFVMP